MSTQLHATIQKLSDDFASHIVQAIRGMSLEEIATLGGARRAPGRPAKATAPRHTLRATGRLKRRSTADLGKTVDKIVAIVKAHKKGINAEDIRAALNVPRKVLPRPMKMALASKKIRKKGHKRATMYFAA